MSQRRTTARSPLPLARVQVRNIIGGRQRDKVPGRYSDISLKAARELVREDRARHS